MGPHSSSTSGSSRSPVSHHTHVDVMLTTSWKSEMFRHVSGLTWAGWIVAKEHGQTAALLSWKQQHSQGSSNPEVTLSPIKLIRYVSLRLFYYIFRIQRQYLPVGFLAGTIWTSLVGAAMFFPLLNMTHASSGKAKPIECRSVSGEKSNTDAIDVTQWDSDMWTAPTHWQQFITIHVYRSKCPLSAVAIMKL